jgi:hypothetical protein
MSEGKPGTTREALIAEMLGDLQVASGKLDQAVATAARMTDRIDASTRSLNVATGEYRTAVDDMAARFRLEIATLMQTATAHAAKAVVSQQTAVLQQAAAAAVQKAIQDGLGSRLRKYFAVAVIASGVISAGIVMTAIKLRWVI